MKARRDFVMRDVAGSTLLVPTGARVVDLNGIITLNATAKCVWQLLDGSHGVEDLVQAVVARFRVEREQARRDVEAFVEQIKALGLLEDAGAAP